MKPAPVILEIDGKRYTLSAQQAQTLALNLSSATAAAAASGGKNFRMATGETRVIVNTQAGDAKSSVQLARNAPTAFNAAEKRTDC